MRDMLYIDNAQQPTRNIKNWGAGGLQRSQPASTFLSRGQERRPKIPTFHIAGTLCTIAPKKLMTFSFAVVGGV